MNDAELEQALKHDAHVPMQDKIGLSGPQGDSTSVEDSAKRLAVLSLQGAANIVQHAIDSVLQGETSKVNLSDLTNLLEVAERAMALVAKPTDSWSK